MDYKALFEDGFDMQKNIECPPPSRLQYLSQYIFEFVTYDGAIDELFASKAIEVCDAIHRRATFEYIKDAENYRWYLLMCNMPFFANRIEWGTSIRGAWWVYRQPAIESCGLFSGEEQILELRFDEKEWSVFVDSLIEFSQQIIP